MKALCAKYIVCIFIVQGAGESATAFRQERGTLTLNIRKITGRSESWSSEKPERKGISAGGDGGARVRGGSTEALKQGNQSSSSMLTAVWCARWVRGRSTVWVL